jgi:hypothetical protein
MWAFVSVGVGLYGANVVVLCQRVVGLYGANVGDVSVSGCRPIRIIVHL